MRPTDPGRDSPGVVVYPWAVSELPLRALSFLLLTSLSCTTATKPPVEASATITEEPNTPPPPARPVPPATRVDSTVDTLHGVQVPDPFRWLEDVESPEVQQWARAQGAFARTQLQPMPGRQALEKRLRELLYVDEVSLPELRGGRLFYLRKHADKEKKVLYFRPLEGGEEKVVLDPNKWSKDGTLALGSTSPSPDGKWLAFLQKPNAADEATLRVAQVESGGWTKVDLIEGAKYAEPSWNPESTGFYYTWLPPLGGEVTVENRPGKAEIRFHQLGSDPATDEVVYPATNDPTWFLGAEISVDGKVLMISQARSGGVDSVFHFKRLGTDKKFRTLYTGPKGEFTAWGKHFYIRTSEGQGRGKLYRTEINRPERRAWKEIIPEDAQGSMMEWSIVGNAISVEYLKNASSEVRLFGLDGKPLRQVPLPGIGNASHLKGEPDQDVAFFSFSSFTVPNQIFRVSVKGGAPELWSAAKVPVDPSPYTVEQVRYPSKDGTMVSMFVVHRKDLVKNGQNPVLLYGYGGFSVPMVPDFSPRIYPWLEAGGVYALANLRGGNEYGEEWHRAGMLSRKQNVFDDFIAAAEYLIGEKYTQPAKLAIRGGSNGGLLVGAAMTQRPDLFGAVICGAPLLDMIRYQLFGSGRTWIPEYGTAEKAEDFQTLIAYSPYQKVKQGQRYPPLLMMSPLRDDRVDPMHSRKFVAAIQHANPDNVALLRLEENAGHGGADQVNRTVDENVDQWSFLFQVLQVQPAAAR